MNEIDFDALKAAAESESSLTRVSIKAVGAYSVREAAEKSLPITITGPGDFLLALLSAGMETLGAHVEQVVPLSDDDGPLQ